MFQEPVFKKYPHKETSIRAAEGNIYKPCHPEAHASEKDLYMSVEEIQDLSKTSRVHLTQVFTYIKRSLCMNGLRTKKMQKKILIHKRPSGGKKDLERERSLCIKDLQEERKIQEREREERSLCIKDLGPRILKRKDLERKRMERGQEMLIQAGSWFYDQAEKPRPP